MVCQTRHAYAHAIRKRPQVECNGVQRVHEGIPGHKNYLYSGSTAHQGLVERQNWTLLALLRVFGSRRMRDWDQQLDEVMKP